MQPTTTLLATRRSLARKAHALKDVVRSPVAHTHIHQRVLAGCQHHGIL